MGVSNTCVKQKGKPRKRKSCDNWQEDDRGLESNLGILIISLLECIFLGLFFLKYMLFESQKSNFFKKKNCGA